MLYEIDEIVEKKSKDNEINRLDRELAGLAEVLNFNGFGDDKQHDKDFESLCAHMQKETTRNVKELTVMEFYSLLTNINKRKDAKSNT